MSMYNETMANNGGTWQLLGNGAIVEALLPDCGYIVGGRIPSVVIPAPLSTPEALNAAVAYIATTLGHTLVGTWVADNGDLHVDAVEVVFSKPYALDLANKRNEIAIWSIHGSESINV